MDITINIPNRVKLLYIEISILYSSISLLSIAVRVETTGKSIA